MCKCDKCNKEFTKRGLAQHKTKVPNCINKCPICLKIYCNQQSLKKHGSVVCIQNFECNICDKKYKSKYDLKYHKCKNIPIVNEIQNIPIVDEIQNIPIVDEIQNNINLDKLIQNIPDNKQVNINITNNINYNNNINKNNSDNVNKIKITNKNKNSFINKIPNNYHFGYSRDPKINYEKLSQMDGYDEIMSDKFMYDEAKFKREQPKDIIYKYEKEMLKTEGMEILFTQLQKNPRNRNTRIKKSKSGKCYIYDNKWIEEKLQSIISKICCKLCDHLYDKETSVNHFIRLIIGTQPRRLSELRKHIESDIVELNEMEKNEELLLENKS